MIELTNEIITADIQNLKKRIQEAHDKLIALPANATGWRAKAEPELNNLVDDVLKSLKG